MEHPVVGARRSKKFVIGAAFVSLTVAALAGTSVLAHADTNGLKGTATCEIDVYQNGTNIVSHTSVENLDAGTQSEMFAPVNQAIPAEQLDIDFTCVVNRSASAPATEYVMTASANVGGEPSCPTCNTNFTEVMRRTESFPMTGGGPITFGMNLDLSGAQTLGRFFKSAGDTVSALTP